MAKKGVPDWLNSSLWSSDLSPHAANPSPRRTPSSPSKPSPPSPKPQPSPQAASIPEPPPSHPAPTPVPWTSQPKSPVGGQPKSPVGGQPESPVGDQPKSPVGVQPKSPFGGQSKSPVGGQPKSPVGGQANPFSKTLPDDVSRQSMLLAELSKKVVNIEELRSLAWHGIPDGAGIRPTIWKLLLGYLANDRSLWAEELERKRAQYLAFKEEFLITPSEITRRLEESGGQRGIGGKPGDSGFLPRSEITQDEHPLSLGKTSMWNQFFQDTEVLEQIDRDIKRTHPDMHFFSGDSSSAVANREAMTQILVIFAKLNPGIKYVQGMNEVLAPLFYIFKNDPDESNAAAAEADAFFCFVELMSGFRDNFCQKLDNSVVGIRSTITKLSELLKMHDEELWRHLEVTTNINPQFYAFRWITLLLTQEFNFADSLHIWDTLLSDPEGPQETLLRICCAMLILVRKRLLAGDFTSNLKLLQNYPSTNIGHLLYVANKLRWS